MYFSSNNMISDFHKLDIHDFEFHWIKKKEQKNPVTLTKQMTTESASYKRASLFLPLSHHHPLCLRHLAKFPCSHRRKDASPRRRNWQPCSPNAYPGTRTSCWDVSRAGFPSRLSCLLSFCWTRRISFGPAGELPPRRSGLQARGREGSALVWEGIF